LKFGYTKSELTGLAAVPHNTWTKSKIEEKITFMRAERPRLHKNSSRPKSSICQSISMFLYVSGHDRN
jgi:hypothetical protein